MLRSYTFAILLGLLCSISGAAFQDLAYGNESDVDEPAQSSAPIWQPLCGSGWPVSGAGSACGMVPLPSPPDPLVWRFQTPLNPNVQHKIEFVPNDDTHLSLDTRVDLRIQSLLIAVSYCATRPVQERCDPEYYADEYYWYVANGTKPKRSK